MQIVKVIKKFKLILSSHQRMRIFEMAILMVAGGFLESMTVSLIVPYMNAVMDMNGFMKKRYVILFCDFFHISSPESMLIWMSIALALIFILKNIYLMFEYNIQYRFVYGNMFQMQRQLLGAFLSRPYEYFLNINSGEILRIINTDTSGAFTILTTLLSLFTELAVSIMLIGAIFIINPLITAGIAGMLLILTAFIYITVKPKLRRAALDQQRAGAGMNKWLLQSIHGIKELKVMRKEEYFRKNYDQSGFLYVQAMRRGQVLSVAPRFIIEGSCMGAVFIAIAILVYRGMNFETLIPMLTAVAMAAIRLLPSVNRISICLSQIAYGEPMLDKVVDNLSLMEIKLDENRNVNREKSLSKRNIIDSFTGNISLNKILFHYPDSNEFILDMANLEIKKGESIGIIGASGGGKTTTIDIMLGLLHPQGGDILVDGMDINEDIDGWLNQISYIPQSIFMLDDTIKNNVAFGESESEVSDENVWKALSEAALDDFVRKLPSGLDTEIGERGMRLSGGQKQRLGIARALYRNPAVIIFDEATSALDHDTENEIMDSVNRLHGKKTLIIIAHRLTTIENCDHVYKVENGKISGIR